MKLLFQEHDPDEYLSFRCSLCREYDIVLRDSKNAEIRVCTYCFDFSGGS